MGEEGAKIRERERGLGEKWEQRFGREKEEAVRGSGERKRGPRIGARERFNVIGWEQRFGREKAQTVRGSRERKHGPRFVARERLNVTGGNSFGNTLGQSEKHTLHKETPRLRNSYENATSAFKTVKLIFV